MKDATRAIIRASLTPESLILGLAAYNFVVVWAAASADCLGFICPWYYAQNFAVSAPARLLVAACLLRAGRAWGYSAAVALCAFILIQYAPHYTESYASGTLLESLRWALEDNPFLSLHTQNLLAGIIVVCAALRWGKSAFRSAPPLR